MNTIIEIYDKEPIFNVLSPSIMRPSLSLIHILQMMVIFRITFLRRILILKSDMKLLWMVLFQQKKKT